MNKKRKYWLIKLHEGLEVKAEFRVEKGHITDAALEELIRTLAAKHALSDEQIVGAYLSEGAGKGNALLELKKSPVTDKQSRSYSCGADPYVTAELVE